jgi:hypothetical protein
MKTIVVDEPYQTGYQYSLVVPAGKDFEPEFRPQLSPQQMLELGIFGGAYFTEPPSEFPNQWFKRVQFSATGDTDKNLNYFKVTAGQSHDEWVKKGWIYFEDPLGWFLWYCRYYQGRRIHGEDKRQIQRWKNMRRHIAQLTSSCEKGDLSCRPRQRQALLHWAYDSRIL